MFNLLPYNEVNEQFSNENGDPGILLATAAVQMWRYRVFSGNIGVISEFENRQSRQFCMKTKMKVEKARREAMHMS